MSCSIAKQETPNTQPVDVALGHLGVEGRSLLLKISRASETGPRDS